MTDYDEEKQHPFLSWDDYGTFSRSIREDRRYVWTKDVEWFLGAVMMTATDRELQINEGEIFFRAQKGIIEEGADELAGSYSLTGHHAERMLPRRNRASEGRANPLGIPVIYAATELITAISEIRPWIGAQVSVARLRTKRRLKAVNLSEGRGQNPLGLIKIPHLLGDEKMTSAELTRVVWASIDQAFSKPVSRDEADVADYAPTQILTELFREGGYDAVIYHSQFGTDGQNIAIFDLDSVDVIKCEPYEIKNVRVEATQIGNSWYAASDAAD
jgi:hypothetical protein